MNRSQQKTCGAQMEQVEQGSDARQKTNDKMTAGGTLLERLGEAPGRLIRQRRTGLKLSKPSRFDRNLVVLGGGAAGLVTSLVGSSLRAGVSLIEAGRMGGDCLNTGCVPSKTLISAARLAWKLKNSQAYGVRTGAVEVDFPAVMQRVRGAIADIAPHDSAERYRGLGVDVIQGYGRFVNPWTVEVTGVDGLPSRQLTSRAVVIATGASPFVPDQTELPGIETSAYVTSDTLWDELWRRQELPERITILGGGPIGCELGQAFQRLGASVTIVDRGDRLLKREDSDVSELVASKLCAEGVRVLTGRTAQRILALPGDGAAGEGLSGGGKLVVQAAACKNIESGQQAAATEEIAHDLLIIALGRKPRLTGFGLEELGIATDGPLVSGPYLETVYNNIFAAGDVAGPYQFTHAAGHQGGFAAINSLFGLDFAGLARLPVSYRCLPHTTFVDPEVARVGLNEQEALQQNIPCELTRFELAELDRAITDSAVDGFLKVLTVPGKDRILGATVVGERATEILAEFTLAMQHGLGLKAILSTVHSYPSFSESARYIAGQWRKSHSPAWALSLLERYHRWRRG